MAFSKRRGLRFFSIRATVLESSSYSFRTFSNSFSCSMKFVSNEHNSALSCAFFNRSFTSPFRIFSMASFGALGIFLKYGFMLRELLCSSRVASNSSFICCRVLLNCSPMSLRILRRLLMKSFIFALSAIKNFSASGSSW